MTSQIFVDWLIGLDK
ncbi:unnamed protein product, partial [Allacma fusca]